MSSFLFGGGKPKVSSEEKIAMAEFEVDTIQAMYHMLMNSCKKKCIPNDYQQPDLNKGESVCLDRCVSKFFEVTRAVSDKMQQQQQALG
ncbi:MAG: protein transporter tim10 [Vezdaea aestivalis]|nr:MAG: protein transporter tim10 [Vezdaea aestivalis]